MTPTGETQQGTKAYTALRPPGVDITHTGWPWRQHAGGGGGNGGNALGEVRLLSCLDETFLEKLVLKTNGITDQLLGLRWKVPIKVGQVF